MIIGSGISGLVAGYTLQQKYDVTLFEANNYFGGHTATIDIELDRKYSIDTGFIVFNDKTYPNFKKLLSQIGINWQDTSMGFSVATSDFEMEYSGSLLDMILVHKHRLFSPKIIKLFSDIIKFNKHCLKLNALDEVPRDLTLGKFLLQNNYGEHFKRYYILPMVSAIWSSSCEEAEDFPLYFFIKFFSNHGLLNVVNRPQWHVVKGGSKQYVEAILKEARFKSHLNRPVKSISRKDSKVFIEFEKETQVFDEVILACHSDQALKLLSDSTQKEREILSSIPYKLNDVTLHTDINLLPKNPRNWASWNYMFHDSNQQNNASLSYNMNILQGIESKHTFVVSLNQDQYIAKDKILRQFKYAHPLFSLKAEKTKLQRQEICGVNHTHFCGAYWYSGFHEDGVRSALDVAHRLGVKL